MRFQVGLQSELTTDKRHGLARKNLEIISPMHSAQEWACPLAPDLLQMSHKDVFVITGLAVYNVYIVHHATSIQNLQQH